MKNTKRNTLSRQEMAELYRDLRNTVATIETKKSKPAASKSDKELAKQIA